MKFNIVLFNEWLDALKSENYNQGKGSLITIRKEKISYCCLGLLCSLNNDLNKTTYLLPNKQTYYFLKNTTLSDWLHDYEFIDEPGNLVMEVFLTKLNDYYNYSFPQIAYWLETHIEFYLARYDGSKLKQLV